MEKKKQVIKEEQPLARRYSKDERKLAYLILALISIAYFVFLFLNSRARPLNVDDFAQIQFVRKGQSLGQVWNNIVYGDLQPPMAAIVSWIWSHIMPYNLQLLKIPSEIFVSAGVFICGICGMRLRNITTGVLTALLAATSSTVFLESSFSLRPYGLVFLAGSLVLLAYIHRNQKILALSHAKASPEECRRALTKPIIWYGVAMTFLAYCHYFGVILCGTLFLTDVILFCRRKVPFRAVLSYLIAGICFLPWGIFGAIPGLQNNINSFWPETPGLRSLWKLFQFICGDKALNTFLILAVLLLFAAIGIFRRRRRQNTPQAYNYICLGGAVLLMIAVVFVYSAYIKPSGSVFVYRYFMAAVPIIFLLVASGLDEIISFAAEKLKGSVSRDGIKIAVAGIFMTVLLVQNFGALQPQPEAYQDAAEWLRQQQDVKDGSALLLTTYVRPEGFNYVMTKNWTLPVSTADSIMPYYIGEKQLPAVAKVYVLYDFTASEVGRDAIFTGKYNMTQDYPEMRMAVYEPIA